MVDIQANTRILIYQCPCPIDATISMGTDQLIWWYSKTIEAVFPVCPKHALLEQGLVAW